MALALAAPTLKAATATIWTGPNITWDKAATSSDIIVAGKVVLTRGGSGVLYNTAASESFPGAASPANTEWAFGNISQATTLSYRSLEAIREQDLRPNFSAIVGRAMVVHLINENIYFSLTFTKWGRFGSGTVAYTRSTAPVAAPPTVTLTAPTASATFADPASVALSANASVSSGTITDVEFFAGATSLGHATQTTSPFHITANLNAGTYSITVVAKANGLSTTSSAATINVVTPVAINLSLPVISQGGVSFTYSANPGLKYAIEKTSDLGSLANWSSVVTNVPTSSPATFSEAASTAAPSVFYRVRREPNP